MWLFTSGLLRKLGGKDITGWLPTRSARFLVRQCLVSYMYVDWIDMFTMYNVIMLTSGLLRRLAGKDGGLDHPLS